MSLFSRLFLALAALAGLLSLVGRAEATSALHQKCSSHQDCRDRVDALTKRLHLASVRASAHRIAWADQSLHKYIERPQPAFEPVLMPRLGSDEKLTVAQQLAIQRQLTSELHKQKQAAQKERSLEIVRATAAVSDYHKAEQYLQKIITSHRATVNALLNGDVSTGIKQYTDHSLNTLRQMRATHEQEMRAAKEVLWHNRRNVSITVALNADFDFLGQS